MGQGLGSASATFLVFFGKNILDFWVLGMAEAAWTAATSPLPGTEAGQSPLGRKRRRRRRCEGSRGRPEEV